MENENLLKAKQLVNEYCRREFGNDADFSDLQAVPLAYTTSEDGESEIQVNLDLVRLRIVSNVDGVPESVEEFNSIEQLVRHLEGIDFDSLVSDAVNACYACERSQKGVIVI